MLIHIKNYNYTSNRLLAMPNAFTCTNKSQQKLV